ncbi:ribosome 60S biogenesis N-terminal-domain-containing protein [Kalaharituber pfeilii]|nr:ribosome 60S biogenesis N-terminal-domain-containing protein [Kalaharituber pfeilii]
MTKMAKRPFAGGSMGPHAAKKLKADHNSGRDAHNTTAKEVITSARYIQKLLSDLSDPQTLQKGYQSFRNFLVECVPEKDGSGERSEAEVLRNKAILREWIESEVTRIGDAKPTKASKTVGLTEGEDDFEKFKTLTQGLGYASQSLNTYLLSAVASALALLVRTTSAIAELNTHGAALCRIIMKQENMKLIYRGITAHQDRVSSPMLRLLTEINKFNYGTLCHSLYAAFDFSVKDLGKNLEPKKSTVGEPGGVIQEDPNKPALRTVYIRFLLSFLQFGSATVKQGILGQRSLISPVFKHLKSDPPGLIRDILDILRIKVVNDNAIPRLIKTQVFNEWALGHISTLYTRLEPILEGADQSKTVARCAHEFLITLCTKPGVGGVCFPENGWYPPGVDSNVQSDKDGGDGEMQGHGQKIHNRTLAAFITTLKPFADTLQQDLLLEIFKAAPELVSGYFNSSSGGGSFSFEPKLTATWIGYCAFLTELVQLPLPQGGFGIVGGASLNPPPFSTMIESILPKVCNRQALKKCLSFDNTFINFLSMRFLVACFTKLGKVLAEVDNVVGTFADGSIVAGKWLYVRDELVEEFSRRLPEMGAVVAAYNASSAVKTGGGLLREVASKLLMQYYILLPEVALAKRFDVNVALGGFLESRHNLSQEIKGMRLLEMEHLLGIAKEAGDVKWWNKSANSPYSSFAVVLNLCLSKSSATMTRSYSRQAKEVLKAVIAQTHIFQQQTPTELFDALLESLESASLSMPSSFDQIITFLDDCLVRCVRTPFKYLDDVAQHLTSTDALGPVSPLVMTLAEQFNYLLESQELLEAVKKDVCIWLGRFFENLVIAGESVVVMKIVAARLSAIVATVQEAGIISKTTEISGIIICFEDNFQAWSDAIFRDKDFNAYSKSVGIRSIVTQPGMIDMGRLEDAIGGARIGETEDTSFDVAVLLTGVASLLNSSNSVEEKVEPGFATKVDRLMDYLEIIILRAKASQSSSLQKFKELIGRDKKYIEAFISEYQSSTRKLFEKRYIELLELLFENRYEEPLDYLVSSVKEALMLYGVNAPSIFPKDQLERILWKYERIFSQFIPVQNFSGIISKLVSQCDPGMKRLAESFLAIVVTCAVEKKADLPESSLSMILSKIERPDMELQKAVARYISSMDGLTLPLNEGVGILKHPKGNGHLICALIKKVGAMQHWALRYIDTSETSEEIIDILSALLDKLSVPHGRVFRWKEIVSVDTKQILGDALEKNKPCIKSLDHPAIANLLQKATSLFPAFDAGSILQRVLADKQRENLSPEKIKLVSALMSGAMKEKLKNTVEKEGKGWFFLIVDHLTRRFGEEKVLSEKSTCLTKEFSMLLRENKMTLSEYVPRASINALLEAAVEKKINADEVIELAAIIADRLEAKDLDLSKLFQMILGNTKNPLAFRQISVDSIHYNMTYLIYRLFSLAKTLHSNVTTLDGVMLLYRGTCNIVDKLLLNIVSSVESYLARSCASRIGAWSFLEDHNDASVSSSTVLVSRSKGYLNITIDERVFQQSIASFAPDGGVIPNTDTVNGFDEFLEVVEGQSRRLSQQYDHNFMLPVLAYILAFSSKTGVTGQAMVEKGGVGYVLIGLCSSDGSVRNAAVQVLNAVINKIEDSNYRARNQIAHLLCAVLASLEESSIAEKPLPTVVGVFLAHAVRVLTEPGHFLYEKLMDMLLRSTFLDLWDVPHMLAVLGNEEDYYREANWKLNVLVQGLRSETDLGLYRKRRVFEACFSMCQNPYAGEKTKQKVIDLLWNMPEVQGGSTTAITRNGVVSWAQQRMVATPAMSVEEKLVWKKVVGRVTAMAAGGHVKEWSKGGLGAHLDEIFTA